MNTTILRDVLYLTMAVIWPEVVVMGHGKGGRSWVIEQKRFDGALEKLDEWARETGLIYTHDDGLTLKVQIAGIEQAAGVKEFCEGWVNAYVLWPTRHIQSPKSGTGLMKYSRDITGSYTVSTEYYENRAKKCVEAPPGVPLRLVAYNLCLADILRAANITEAEAQP